MASDLNYWGNHKREEGGLTHGHTVDTDQVEHSVGMSCELGHLGEGGVLPHQDLVLGITVCADLQRTNITFSFSTDRRISLGRTSAHGSGGRVM